MTTGVPVPIKPQLPCQQNIPFQRAAVYLLDVLLLDAVHCGHLLKDLTDLPLQGLIVLDAQSRLLLEDPDVRDGGRLVLAELLLTGGEV